MQEQLEQVRAHQRAQFLKTWKGGEGLVGRESQGRWKGERLTEGDNVIERLTQLRHPGDLEGSLVSAVHGTCCDPCYPPIAVLGCGGRGGGGGDSRGDSGGGGGGSGGGGDNGGDSDSGSSGALSGVRCWRTTGLFPQHLVLAFVQPVVITKIDLETTGIRELRIASCAAVGGGRVFDELTSHVYDAQGRAAARPSALQQHAFAVPALRTQELMFTLVSGNGDFCSVQRLEVFGRPAPLLPEAETESHRPPLSNDS